MAFPFHAVSNNTKLNSDARYRPILMPYSHPTASVEELAEFMVDRGTLFKKAHIIGLLDEIAEAIPQFIYNTRRAVKLGGIAVITPCVTGAMKHANDPADPAKNRLELRITPLSYFRHSMARTPLENVNRNSGCILGLKNEKSNIGDEVEPGADYLMMGENIYVAPYKAGESTDGGRVWLETVNGDFVAEFSVTQSNPKAIWANLAEDVKLSARRYVVVVESYGSPEALTLQEKLRRLCVYRLSVDNRLTVNASAGHGKGAGEKN